MTRFCSSMAGMRYVVLALLLVVACTPPPRRSAGRRPVLTIQHCGPMPIEAAPTGRPATTPAAAAAPAAPPPQVRIGDIAVAGGEDAVAGQVRAVVDEALPRLRRCYQQTAAADHVE